MCRRDSCRRALAAGVKVWNSIVLVARIALVNRDMLKHRTILVDSCFSKGRDGGSSSTRNWPTLNSSAPVPYSVDGSTARCAEGGRIVLAGVGLSHACGASTLGNNSDADRSARPQSHFHWRSVEGILTPHARNHS